MNLQQITPRAEAIAPGATLRHGFTLNGVTAAEAAVALLRWRRGSPIERRTMPARQLMAAEAREVLDAFLRRQEEEPAA